MTIVGVGVDITAGATHITIGHGAGAVPTLRGAGAGTIHGDTTVGAGPDTTDGVIPTMVGDMQVTMVGVAIMAGIPHTITTIDTEEIMPTCLAEGVTPILISLEPPWHPEQVDTVGYDPTADVPMQPYQEVLWPTEVLEPIEPILPQLQEEVLAPMPSLEIETTEQAEAPVLHQVIAEQTEVIVPMALHHQPEAIPIAEVILLQEVLQGTVPVEVQEAINPLAEQRQGVAVIPDLPVVPEVLEVIEVVVAAQEVLEVTEAVVAVQEAPEA